MEAAAIGQRLVEFGLVDHVNSIFRYVSFKLALFGSARVQLFTCHATPCGDVVRQSELAKLCLKGSHFLLPQSRFLGPQLRDISR